MILLTFVVPDALINGANQIAKLFGFSDKNFRPASWLDGDGNQYTVSSGQWPEGALDALEGDLAETDGVDMGAANAAKDAIVFVHPGDDIPAADPDKIICLVGSKDLTGVGIQRVVSELP